MFINVTIEFLFRKIQQIFYKGLFSSKLVLILQTLFSGTTSTEKKGPLWSYGMSKYKRANSEIPVYKPIHSQSTRERTVKYLYTSLFIVKVQESEQFWDH
jgi:hypothetical protein